jgi:hypothetical protein
MEVSGQLHTWLLYAQRKSPQYPLNGRLGGTKSQSEFYGEEKTFAPARNRTNIPHCQACSLVTILQLISEDLLTLLLLVYCLLDGGADCCVMMLMKQRFTIYVLSITSAFEL